MLKLSQTDVERLLNESSGEIRADLATKVAGLYPGELRPTERALAEEIFRTMLEDIDVQVRAALAETLQHNPYIPHEIAVALAKDVEEVAVPMLNMSLVLSDDDLIEIVRSRPLTHQLAIAGRRDVSGDVADALIDSGNDAVIVTLLRNESAEFDEPRYGRVIDIFSGKELVMDAMAERPELPVAIVERLTNLVSEHLRLSLILDRGLPAELAEPIVLQARDRVTMEMLPAEIDPAEVEELVAGLHSRGRLTASLILRAFCEGDFVFATAALAKRAGVPVQNAWTLLHDENATGIAPLCQKAGLSDSLRDIAYLSVSLARSIEAASELEARFQYRGKLVKQFSSSWPDLNADADIETLIAHLVAAGVANETSAAA